MICFNHTSVFYTNNTSWKIAMKNKFNAQTLTGSPSGNLCRYVLVSLIVLNMSYIFGQSTRSIESRCVVNTLSHLDLLQSHGTTEFRRKNAHYKF